jgi:hypothetical protein
MTDTGTTVDSRQPLLVRMCRCVCAVTLVFRLFVLPCTMANHGGLTPPALVLVCGRLPVKQRFLRCTNVHSTKSGGRQPAVVRATFWHRKTNTSCVASVRIKSGGRQPAVVPKNACATAIVYGRVIAFLADDRHRHHGRLTPTAPGCTRAYRRKCGVAICNGLRPGWG